MEKSQGMRGSNLKDSPSSKLHCPNTSRPTNFRKPPISKQKGRGANLSLSE